MGPGVSVTTVLPLNPRSQELIAEIASELQPYFPDITAHWRDRLTKECELDQRCLATLERTVLCTGAAYFSHGDVNGFFEHLTYIGSRLSKLDVDLRLVRRSLAAYERESEPYIAAIFGDVERPLAAMETLSSAVFACLSNAYFDTRAREKNALLRVLDAELVDAKLDAMLQRVLEITCKTFDASMGVVLLKEADSDLLRMEALVGWDAKHRGEFSIALGQGICGSIARSGEPELVMDVARDPRLLATEVKEKAKTLWGMPIRYDGQVIGVILIGFAKPYEWMPTERNLLKAIADRSALAINRARMTQTLREREARIAELSSHLLKAQEEERRRISRELHDETGQGLMVIRLYLEMLNEDLKEKAQKGKVGETVEVVDRTIEGIRRIISKLSPMALQELGLFAALRKEAKDLEKNRGVKTRVAIAEDVGRLSAETEMTIYRIVQEALHNVAKHAKAQKANVSMTRADGQVTVLVEDDGVGIFPKSNFRGNSFGLAGIKERVGMLGGVVRVVSMKGKGTRIEIKVPATEPLAGIPMAMVASEPGMFRAATAELGESDKNAKDKVSTH
jgi:signal transduction histidine kinase